MNTYSSVKSFDSQIHGRKVVEPNIAVTHNRHHQSPKLHSPEQNLDQFTEKKLLVKPLKKKKIAQSQGQQGKPTKQTVKKVPLSIKKRSVSPAKKTVKKNPPKKVKEQPKQKKLNDQERREQLGLGYLNEKQIKQLKKIKKTKETKHEEMKPKYNHNAIKMYIQQKRKLDSNLTVQTKVVRLLEHQRKMENLNKLNESVKEIFNFKKCKTSENSQPQTPKVEFRKTKKGIDKTIELKQKFQEISKRFQFVQQESISKQEIEEEHSEQSEQSQLSENQFHTEVQNILSQFEPSQYLIEKIQWILEQQEYVDPQNLSRNEIEILQYHFLSQAATMIQKVWRGYIMRKQFLAELEHFVRQEQEEQSISSEQQQQQQQQQQQKQSEYSVQYEDQADDEVVIIKNNTPQNQDLYFYNPFANNNQGEKQIHYSTIKSSIVSEDDQKSVLQSSILIQLQQEMEQWNSQIEQIIKDKKDTNVFDQVKMKMQNTILNIVQQHIKKQKESHHHERQDSETSEPKQRIIQETHFEKSFNEARKKLQKTLEISEEKYSPKEQSDLNRSSLISLQSQLMKRENELLSMREEAIQLRYKAELKKLGQTCPELDDWLQKELEDLRVTRQAIEISRKREANALKKIQRDILVAQTYDDQNSEAQCLQKQINEQFNNYQFKPQQNENIKIVTHFNQEEVEEIPETLSEEMHVDDEKLFNQNIIESDQQIEIYQTVSQLTNDILDQMISNLSQEILDKKDQFEIVIQNLLSNQPQPGIVTSVNEIRGYINNFFEYIYQHHKDQFIQNLNVSYGFTPIKRMQLIHGYDEDEDEEEPDVNENQLAFPLDEALFLEYEQHRLQQSESTNDSATYAMKELEHIHNKAIFDACNEALNYFRPYYSNSGAPYPWEQKNAGQFQTEDSLRQVVSDMEEKVVRWALTLGGFLPVEDELNVAVEKQLILEEKNQQMMLQQVHSLENPLLFDSQMQIQFDHIAQIRDERLYKMLISDIKEQENKWYLFEDDRTEFLMEMADMLFEQLVEEMAAEQVK